MVRQALQYHTAVTAQKRARLSPGVPESSGGCATEVMDTVSISARQMLWDVTAACATGVKVSPLLTAPRAPTLSSAWHLMENQEPPAVTPHKPDKLRD